MKRILIPTDFSDCALNAAKVAVSIAQKTGASLYFFTRTFAYEYEDYMTESELKSIPEIQERLQNVEKNFAELFTKLKLNNLNVYKFSKRGDTEKEILDYSRAISADLIVMGTHGVSGLKEWALGSVTQKIVRRAECPVLTIKEVPKKLSFDNIVFLSNFDEEAKEPFKQACHFAQNYNAKIHLLNIDTPSYFTEIPFLIKEAMTKFADTYDGEIEKHRFDAWNVENGLKNFLNTTEADLVIIPTHGKRGLRYLFFNSLAEGIVNHLNFPIMTIRI